MLYRIENLYPLGLAVYYFYYFEVNLRALWPKYLIYIHCLLT